MGQKEGLSYVNRLTPSNYINWAITHYHYPVPSITLVGHGRKSGVYLWRDRWFILTTGRLMIFRKQTEHRDGTGAIPLWSIHLSSVKCEEKNDAEIMLTCIHRKFHFRFPNRWTYPTRC
jgi:hypothetical protein